MITDAQNLMPSCVDCAVSGQTLCLHRHSAYSTPHLKAHGQLLTESDLVAQIHSINTGRRAHHGCLRAEETEVQAPDCSNLDLLLTRLSIGPVSWHVLLPIHMLLAQMARRPICIALHDESPAHPPRLRESHRVRSLVFIYKSGSSSSGKGMFAASCISFWY